MRRRVALLRGVNVGGAKRVPMASLRAIAAKLGFENIQTVLNSGNLVFDAPDRANDDLAQRIREEIARDLGVATEVIVLSAEHFAQAVSESPFDDLAANPARLLVTFMAEPRYLAALKPLTSEEWEPEALALGKRAAYLSCPGGVSESPLWKAVERQIGVKGTSRNWSTLAKVLKCM